MKLRILLMIVSFLVFTTWTMAQDMSTFKISTKGISQEMNGKSLFFVNENSNILQLSTMEEIGIPLQTQDAIVILTDPSSSLKFKVIDEQGTVFTLEENEEITSKIAWKTIIVSKGNEEYSFELTHFFK